MPARSRLRLVVPAAIVLAVCGVAWQFGYFDLDGRDKLLALARVTSGSPYAAPLFVAAYVAAVLLCLPATILTVVAGALFGFVRGALVAWLASVAGTLIAHTIARSIGRHTVERLFGGDRLLDRLRRHSGARNLIALRVIPLGPFGMLSYAAGLADIPLRRLLLATGLGITPTLLAYAFAGSQLRVALESGGTEAHRALAIAGGVSLTIVVGASIIAWMHRRSEAREAG